jgi:hypothetical protein
MLRFSEIVAGPVEPARTAALPLPPELSAGVSQSPRVMRLIDLDSVSHGLAWGTSRDRASNQAVQLFLDIVQSTARAIDAQSRVRYAASTATAACHLDVLTTSGNNQWSIRRGLGGADQALIEEMNDLIGIRMIATKPGQKSALPHTGLVILAGADHIYTPPVRQLRLLGIPTWLIVPGRHVAASLYSSSWAVSFLGPDILDLTNGGQIKLFPAPHPLPPDGE